jgi:DNA repair photolyase
MHQLSMSSPNSENQPSSNAPSHTISGFWDRPATMDLNNFIYKSLCNFAFNTAVGCIHGCRFCYVPDTSTNKLAPQLAKLGVNDPDEEWGHYVFPRQWDEEAFLKSLRRANNIPADDLPADGHRAVMFCTTTDPYQIIKNADPAKGRELTTAHQKIVRRSNELIRDHSTLNVRILTRSPLAKLDFEIMKSLGHRLLFGMSLPTLNNNLAKIYEPYAPAPSKRLETLQAAKDAGLHVYVAVAPTYPECDEADLRATLTAVAALEPVTVFHEPINIRAENVERIRLHGESIGVNVNTSVFAPPDAWRKYAIGQLQMVERIAGEVSIADRLHLWPDASLDSNVALASYENPLEMHRWIKHWHHRISEWPKAAVTD